MGRNYWMVVGSLEDFGVTKELGLNLLGVGLHYRRRAQRMQPDDKVLFYVTSIMKWTAIATITSRSFEDHTPVWKPTTRGEQYPYRVKLAPEIVLDESDYIDALILAPRLEYIKRWAPEDWPLAFTDRLHLLPQRDFRLIEREMKRLTSKGRRRQRRRRQQPEPDMQTVGEVPVQQEEPVHREPAPEGLLQAAPMQDEATHEELVQGAPMQDEATHEEPVQGAPMQDEATHEEPVQEAPMQDEAAEQESVEDEPSRQEPVQEAPPHQEESEG